MTSLDVEVDPKLISAENPVIRNELIDLKSNISDSNVHNRINSWELSSRAAFLDISTDMV